MPQPTSFPQLHLPPGVTWNYKKSPRFNNISLAPQSARHPANSTLQSGTIFGIELVFNYLKQVRVTTAGTTMNDLQYLQSFYEACGGGNRWFLFDPAENNFEDSGLLPDQTQVKSGFSGVTDGVTTSYPLWRATSALGNGLVTLVERIQFIDTFVGLYLNGAYTNTGYTLSQYPATVNFTVPPSAGQNLCWAGTWQYLCQFAEDTLDFNEWSHQLWELRTLKLTTVNI